MFRFRDKIVALAATALLASGHHAVAQSTVSESVEAATTATSQSADLILQDFSQNNELRSCLDPRASTGRDIAAYMAGPKAFFDGAISRQALLSIPSRNIAIQQPSLSESLVKVAGIYGFETKPGREILAGLGQAALICVNRASNAAVYIQEQVALTANREAIDAFRVVTGDNRPAAISTNSGPAVQAVSVGRTTQSVSSGSALPIQIDRQPARANRPSIERSPAGTVQTTASYTFAASSLFFEVDNSDDSNDASTATSGAVAVPSVASPTQ